MYRFTIATKETNSIEGCNRFINVNVSSFFITAMMLDQILQHNLATKRIKTTKWNIKH